MHADGAADTGATFRPCRARLFVGRIWWWFHVSGVAGSGRMFTYQHTEDSAGLQSLGGCRWPRTSHPRHQFSTTTSPTLRISFGAHGISRRSYSHWPYNLFGTARCCIGCRWAQTSLHRPSPIRLEEPSPALDPAVLGNRCRAGLTLWLSRDWWWNFLGAHPLPIEPISTKRNHWTLQFLHLSQLGFGIGWPDNERRSRLGCAVDLAIGYSGGMRRTSGRSLEHSNHVAKKSTAGDSRIDFVGIGTNRIFGVTMISVDEAREILTKTVTHLNAVYPLGCDWVSLTEALGRVTAQDISAKLAVPLFHNSAMDGYAVQAVDATQGARLSIVGEHAAGSKNHEVVSPSTCVRIMTGAPLPQGADAVIKREDVQIEDECIVVQSAVPVGNNIRRRGEDIEEGANALSAGLVLEPALTSFLRSVGVERVPVVPHPKIWVLVTGKELADAPEQLKPGQILDSNSVFLQHVLKREGISPHRVMRVDDNLDAMRRAIGVALDEADVLIITGGASVGDYDYTRSVLGECGVRELFWRVAQKPGKPIYAGEKNSTLVLGLPGNPYAVAVCTWLYVLPALRHRMGRENAALRSVWLPLDHSIRKRGDRTHFLKAALVQRGSESRIRVLDRQGSHQLRSLTHADGLLCFPDNFNELEAGELVSVMLWP